MFVLLLNGQDVDFASVCVVWFRCLYFNFEGD